MHGGRMCRANIGPLWAWILEEGVDKSCQDVLREAVEDWSMVWRTQLKSPRRRGGTGRDR